MFNWQKASLKMIFENWPAFMNPAIQKPQTTTQPKWMTAIADFEAMQNGD